MYSVFYCAAFLFTVRAGTGRETGPEPEKGVGRKGQAD